MRSTTLLALLLKKQGNVFFGNRVALFRGRFEELHQLIPLKTGKESHLAQAHGMEMESKPLPHAIIVQ